MVGILYLGRGNRWCRRLSHYRNQVIGRKYIWIGIFNRIWDYAGSSYADRCADLHRILQQKFQRCVVGKDIHCYDCVRWNILRNYMYANQKHFRDCPSLQTNILVYNLVFVPRYISGCW